MRTAASIAESVSLSVKVRDISFKIEPKAILFQATGNVGFGSAAIVDVPQAANHQNKVFAIFFRPVKHQPRRRR